MNSTFKVGDQVRVPLGRRGVIGVITEDRGPIGFRGRRLYQVRVPMEPAEPAIYELAGVEIEAIDPLKYAAVTMDKKQVIDYLASGGLITILDSNRQGGKYQPRVWLCPDSVGNVTH